MTGQQFRKNQILQWFGQRFRIEGRLSNGKFQLKNESNKAYQAVSEAELRDELFNDNLQILGENNEYLKLQTEMNRRRVHDLTALADDDPRKAKAIRRQSYVQAVLKSPCQVYTNNFLDEMIAKVAAGISDQNPPSIRSLRRWLNNYRSTSEDSRSLVDADRAKGNRNRKFGRDEEQKILVAQVIEESINEIYLTLERQTIQAVYDKVEVKIHRINETRDELNKLVVPHYTTIRRAVLKLDAYLVDKARYGERIANARHKAYRQGPRPTRPLERVECDDTKVDLFVIDPVHLLPLGRPTFFAVIDVHTKMILGYFLSFFPPSYLSAMLCLRHAIKPKTYVSQRYPLIKNEWGTYGLMEVLVVDNAKHWTGKDLEDACWQLGINIIYAPVRVPWFKSSIERFFKTLNSRLLHSKPGTTFSNIFDRQDYDPAKNAVITLDLLEELLHKWIIDVYSQDEHRGIRDIPARLWNIGISKYPPLLPASSQELNVLLGKVEYRVVSPSGIELFGLKYNDDSLARLRSGRKSGEKFKVKYDPADLGLIHVYDKFRGDYLPVPACDPDYASGLTEWQHRVIRKFARQRIKENLDEIALAEAKDYLQTRVKEFLSSEPAKSKTNIQAARFLSTVDSTQPRIIYNSSAAAENNSSIKQTGAKTKNLRLYEDSAPIDSPVPIQMLKLSSTPNSGSDDIDVSDWEANYDLPR